MLEKNPVLLGTVRTLFFLFFFFPLLCIQCFRRKVKQTCQKYLIQKLINESKQELGIILT